MSSPLIFGSRLFTLEHKNMPLEDAVGLVDRDFERYCQGVREGRIPPRRLEPSKQQVGQLLTKAAAGEQLNPDQLQSVIAALQKQHSSTTNPPPGRPSEPGQSHTTHWFMHNFPGALRRKKLGSLGTRLILLVITFVCSSSLVSSVPSRL